MQVDANKQEEYDRLYTLLALNMAIGAIHRIISTKDRIVLHQEYINIINNLAFGNIERDEEMIELHSELLNFITGKELRQEDIKRVQEQYNRREQQLLSNAIAGVQVNVGNLWNMLGSLVTSCVSQYFSYQDEKQEIFKILDEGLRKLSCEEMEKCNYLQVKLLNSSWNLLRQYRLPDEYRLTQDSLDGFYSALNEPDTARRLRRLQVKTIERNFQAYPPYWFYRARAAQELNQADEAAKCYAKFNEIWRPVLRRDPYKLEAEKYAILTLTKDPNKVNKAEIKKHLAAIQENLADNDWSNNLFAGVVYFLLGGKDNRAEAIRLLEDNVIAGLETDVSGVILAQMEAVMSNPESLPNELKNFEEREKLIAQAEDRELASALITYFEDDEKSGTASLERLSENSENPVVFRALAIIERSRKSTHLDYPKIFRLQTKESSLQKTNTHSYEAVRPLLEHYAEQGNDLAMMLLGYMYLYGLGVEQNLYKAIDRFSAPAENGNVYAQTSMGAAYYRRYDYPQALKWYQKAAEQGYAYAQVNLGMMYDNGCGVEQDDKKAFDWYSKAAEQGYADAQFYLGVMYENGDGVARDDKKAFEWYSKAAEQGHAEAQCNLGNMYYSGQGVEQDDKKAVEWYSKAAEQGDAGAQYNLGVAYDNGDGVTQDYKKAFDWLQKAAEQGFPIAQFNLGNMYREGRGVAQDYKKAFDWFRKAAEQGDAGAQYNLGVMYKNGDGVAQDLGKAREWYQKAANQGHEKAKKRLGR